MIADIGYHAARLLVLCLLRVIRSLERNLAWWHLRLEAAAKAKAGFNLARIAQRRGKGVAGAL